MTRRDYELLARAISQSRALVKADTWPDSETKNEAIDTIVNVLVGALKADNVRFDRNAFRKAAGL